jgi:hypothetical protein
LHWSWSRKSSTKTDVCYMLLEKLTTKPIYLTRRYKFFLTLCFWDNCSHFLLISWRWARIWQWKLKIGYGF